MNLVYSWVWNQAALREGSGITLTLLWRNGWKLWVTNAKESDGYQILALLNYTGQQNLTFFFGTRGKIPNPNRTFNAEFKCVSSFSPSPTVCLWEPS